MYKNYKMFYMTCKLMCSKNVMYHYRKMYCMRMYITQILFNVKLYFEGNISNAGLKLF